MFIKNLKQLKCNGIGILGNKVLVYLNQKLN